MIRVTRRDSYALESSQCAGRPMAVSLARSGLVVRGDAFVMQISQSIVFLQQYSAAVFVVGCRSVAICS